MTTTPSTPASTRPCGPASTRTDEELLAGTRAGRATSYAELYRRYEPDTRRFARAVAHPNDVDDVVAESFARMLRAMRRDKGPVDFPVRYLMVTVRRTAAGMHAKRARANEMPHRLGPPLPVQEPLSLLADEQLAVAFRSLSARQRRVVWWTEVEGLTPVEVGERLDISPNAAAALAYRARRALRQAYGSPDAGQTTLA